MPCPTLPVVIGRSLPLLICLVTCGALAATANEPSGPIIDWNLQKRSTSIGRSHSELQRAASAPLRFDPQPPHALRFSASQEALRTTSLAAPLPQNALSVQLWVRPEANQHSFGLICCQKSGQIGWLLGGDRDHFFFALHCKNKKGPTQLTARPFYQNAQWYQITATYDGQQQKIYVDGTLAGEAFEQRGGLLPLDSPKIEIGVLPSRNENQKGPTFFSGQIGAIRVWNRVLSASEIKAQFAAEHASYPGALAEYDASRDWPTFGHDNHRSRRAGSEPDLPLHLAWSRKIRPGPRPAWPPPARQDFWNRKENLKPRVAFDRCFEPVVADGKVYLGSSSEDQLYCFDLASGEELWSFFAEAPIRLAPTVVDGRVLFGSDDGGVYCLDADSGEEIWRYKPAGDYFPGNGRLVHPQLVRSGIFVEAGKVWFTAGLFPRQGVYLVALDLRDGTLFKKTDLSRSPQGYLRRLGGRLFAPTGRNLRGAVLQSLDGKTKDPVIQRPQLLAPFDRTAIAAGSLVFAGGPGTVAAFSRDKNQKLWEENIEGTCGKPHTC